MSSSNTYYHNPRCSKSRQGLALLQEKKTPLTVREYLKDPLSNSELTTLFKKLNRRPIDCIRKGDAAKLALTIPEDSDDAVIALIAQHPILLERPILETPQAAQIGRPPESLLDILP